MNKVINGKRYDTETTTKKAMACANVNTRDFSYWEETLYQKRTGEYFLYGQGGPMSRYAVSEGNNTWSGGSKIIPLTESQARKWAEQHLNGDEYDEIFSLPDDEAGKKMITLSLPEGGIERIRSEAGKAGVTMSEYITRLVK